MLLTTLTFDVPRSNNLDDAIDVVLAGKQFGITSWLARAWLTKGAFDTIEAQRGMTSADQVTFVRESMRLVAQFQQAQSQIAQIFTDPLVRDAMAASADLRARRDALRQQIDSRQNLTEAILQAQVESVLRDEGFGVGGQILPPLRFRFTELPDVMIVSRRDKIERINQRELLGELPLDEQTRLEQQVDERFDVSSLITPIGGLGAYPAMLPENASLRFTVATAAHEWSHNYLLMRLAPVAVRYLDDPTARVINETAASIFERDVAPKVLQRFYPEASAMVAEPPLHMVTEPAEVATCKGVLCQQQTPFNFQREMRETRLKTDALLAEGKIVAAEQYMEQRRALFVQNGYPIRKLNQAYFAFYGAYNAEPGGAPTAGRDPIGPAVQALRARSASAYDFLDRIARVRGLADLQE